MVGLTIKMKVQNKKNIINKKTLLLTGITILVIVLAVGGYYIFVAKGTIFGWSPLKQTTSKGSSIDYGSPTKDQMESGNTIKSGQGNDRPPTPTPISGSDKSNVEVSITAANQNGSVVQVRAFISAVENSGTCTLTMTKSGSNSVKRTADIQPSASISTCKGFDVPTSELSTGTWHIKIAYDSTSLTGSTEKDITIQ